MFLIMQPKQPRKKRAGSSSSSKDEVVRGEDEEVEEEEEKGKVDVSASDKRSCKRPKNPEILAGGETIANSGGTARTMSCGQQAVTVGGRGERGATGMGGGALGGGSSAQERERLLQNEDTCSNTPEGGRFRGVFVDSVPLASLNAASVQGEAALMSVVKTAVKSRIRLSLRRTRGAARGAGGGEGR